MRVTFDEIEDGAKDKVREWVGDKGRVLHVWTYDGTYYVVVIVPGTFDPILLFLRVWFASDSWVLSQDESLNLAVVLEEVGQPSSPTPAT